MSKKLLSKIIGFLFAGVVLFFLFRILFNSWGDIKAYDFQFNYFYLLLSFLCAISAIFLIGIVWKNILGYLGYRNLSFNKAIEINVLTNFSKYIPGKLWGVVGLVYLAKDTKIPKSILAYSYVLQTAIGVISAIFWGSVLTIFYLGRTYHYLYYFLVLAIFFLILILKQKYFICALNYSLKKFKKGKIDKNIILSQDKVIRTFLQLSLIRFLNGFGFFLLLMSFFKVSWVLVPVFMGAYILANVSGYLAFFAPAGIGIKEGALLLLLQFYLSTGIAVLVSLLSRLWLSISDILAFGFFILYKFLNKIRYVRNIRSGK